ncbi:transcriptional regulator [Sodalis sp. RH16]|uniref:transcriptional regulator n=1 Tax=Sodalis sp. RH16 TaxID=3394331 RepID=UPI0039B4C4ED
MTGLDTAIRSAGSASKLSAVLGISKMSVSLWKKNGIPADRVIPIYKATGVTPHELRPDLYPNPSDGLPQPQQQES